MGELYSFVRHRDARHSDDLCCKNSLCRKRSIGVAQQLKLHRKRKEQEAMLDALTGEATMLRKLMLLTEDNDRRDDYTRLVASVDCKRLILSRQLEEERGQ